MAPLWAALLGAWALLAPLPGRAAAPPPASPLGFWKTIDDDGRTEKSVVQITESAGELRGRIVALIRPPLPNPSCRYCRGGLKDRPILGLLILWGFKPGPGPWKGGRVLDPENGRDYACRLDLEDGGRRLKLRGYLGLALFGRTQHWVRVAAPAGPPFAAPR